MDTVGYEAAKRLIDRAMPHYVGFPAKLRTDDHDMEMATTAVAGMSGVQRAIVADLESDWRQHLQAALDLFV